MRAPPETDQEFDDLEDDAPQPAPLPPNIQLALDLLRDGLAFGELVVLHCRLHDSNTIVYDLGVVLANPESGVTHTYSIGRLYPQRMDKSDEQQATL